MTLVDRSYPDIVRDVLTNLTQGVAGEVHRVDYDPLSRPVVVPTIELLRRPVRRVSLVAGLVAQPGRDEPVPVTFSLNDYELLPDAADATDLHTIRFLPGGRRPAPGTDVRVNYYPRTTDPTPLTDVSVGSVTRTLVEAISKELALAYEQLNLAYDAGYLESATGGSLDRVVALLGYTRYRAGRPVGSVRFGRRAGSVGDVSIPAGTPVTDQADTVRYLTVESRTMLAGESTAEVRVRGAADDTPVVGPGVLTVIQRAIAGLDTVTNERPTGTAFADESDDELRARARVALLASNKGTLGALEHGLLQMPDVRAVTVVEMPNGVPGEVRLDLSLTEPGSAIPASVRARIDELRPAGIQVVPALAASADLAVHIGLVLAGSHLAPAETQQVRHRATAAVTEVVGRVGVGQPVRTGPLTAAILADNRVVDATVSLGRKGSAPAAAGVDFSPQPGEAVRLAAADVSFAAETFERASATSGDQVLVRVVASVAAQPVAGASLDAVRAQITARLAGYVSGLAAGATVTVAGLLPVLRDDANYQIDPLRLRVTFHSDEQFVEVAQGGPAFTVRVGHTFELDPVEVLA